MTIQINPHRLLSALSLCLDFTREGIARHHHRVAYIGTALAGEIGLPGDEKELVFLASLIHDAGVSTWGEKQKLIAFEVDEPWEHCSKGAEMIRRVDFLRPLAEIIFGHHDCYGGGNRSGHIGKEIPLAARIIHLADRVDVLTAGEKHVLSRREDFIRAIEEKTGRVFDPELFTAFKSLAGRESFWLDLVSPLVLHEQINSFEIRPKSINLSAARQIAALFAAIVDDKSSFTHRHSRDVAGVAVQLAAALGFTDEKLIFMEIAGLLHDLGKLSIPDEILEKPAVLSTDEFALIKQHTYYTYHILKEAGAPPDIIEWAAYHHEKLNGGGYPFHLDASCLTTGARIMAVADVFTALSEGRPYRPGLARKNVEAIMGKMVMEGALDGAIVKTIFDLVY